MSDDRWVEELNSSSVSFVINVGDDGAEGAAHGAFEGDRFDVVDDGAFEIAVARPSAPHQARQLVECLDRPCRRGTARRQGKENLISETIAKTTKWRGDVGVRRGNGRVLRLLGNIVIVKRHIASSAKPSRRLAEHRCSLWRISAEISDQICV